MKKTILILFVLIGFGVSAQTIDTTFKQMAAIKVQPFKAKFDDTTNVTHLGVMIVGDNLSTSCTVYWALFNDKAGKSIGGNATVSGEDYKDWSGDNIFLFKFVANKLKIKWL